MAKRKSKLARSIREIAEIQVNDWDFKALLNKDISELEVGRSLRRLANIRVMEWDLKSTVPAIKELATHEFDLDGLIRRAAAYKVMEWDFRNALPHAGGQTTVQAKLRPTPEETQAVISRLKNFLQFVVVNLIDEPDHARIRAREEAPGVLRFDLVLVKKDVAILIGTGGHTAAAIRNILKETAITHGLHAMLRIRSHEEDTAG